MKIDFKEIFNKYISSKQKTWSHDRTKTVGASEIFGCMRQVFFKKNSYEVDEEFQWGAAERGNIIEDHFVVPAFELAWDENFVGGGDNQNTFLSKYLSATPDGLIDGLEKDALAKYGILDIESDCLVTEFKSVDPRMNLTEEKAIHKGQTIAQLGMIREQTDFKPMYGVIIYIDASFLDEIKVFVVKFDEDVYQVAQDRAKKIMTASEPDELKPEGKITGACTLCSFKSHCADAIINSVPQSVNNKITEEELKEAESLAQDFKRLKKIEKDTKQKIEEYKLDISDFLEAKGSKSIKGEGFSIGLSARKGKTSTDLKAIKEAYGITDDDMENYQKEGNPFTVLMVK